MPFEIRQMTISDYESAYALWEKTPGIGLSDADSRENIHLYLQRNSGFSFVASCDGKLVGAVLCGHDGRRGYLHHLVVDERYQKQQAGKLLVENCMNALEQLGIKKCHIFVYRDNEAGKAFWEHIGWKLRLELDIMSFDI